MSVQITSPISKCPKVTVILSYWEASGEVSKLRYIRVYIIPVPNDHTVEVMFGLWKYCSSHVYFLKNTKFWMSFCLTLQVSHLSKAETEKMVRGLIWKYSRYYRQRKNIQKQPEFLGLSKTVVNDITTLLSQITLINENGDGFVTFEEYKKALEPLTP